MMRYVAAGLAALLLTACDGTLPREPVEPIDPFEGLELTLELDTGWVASGGPFGARLLIRNAGEEPSTLGDACGGGLALPLLMDADGGAYRPVGAPTECAGGLQELELAAGEEIERAWELRALAVGEDPEQEPERLATGTYTLAAELTVAHVAGNEVEVAPSVFAELELQDALDPVRISFVVVPQALQPLDSLVAEFIVENVSDDTLEVRFACLKVPFIPHIYDPDGNQISLDGHTVPNVCLPSGDVAYVAPADTMRVWFDSFEREMTRYEFLAAYQPDSETEAEPLTPGVYTIEAEVHLQFLNGIYTWLAPFYIERQFEVLASSP